MTFQPGDVCEVLPVKGGLLNHWAGRQVVVKGPVTTRSGRICYATVPMPRSHIKAPGRRFVGWWPESLRKINPPDWQPPVVKVLDVEA